MKKMKKMKPIFVAAYLENNFGDDLFIYVLSKLFPNREFVLSGSKENMKQFDRLKNVHFVHHFYFNKFFIKFVKIFKVSQLDTRRYRAFVEIGGSIFQQLSNEDEIPYGRKKWLKTKTPYFVIGSNFGPFIESSFVRKYHNFFCESNASVTFRDKYSKHLFKDLAGVSVAPDAVLNLPFVYDCKPKCKERVLVVAPIDLTLKERANYDELNPFSCEYERKTASMIESFINDGYRVVIMTFCVNEGDLNSANRIKGLVDVGMLSKVTICSTPEIETKLEILKNSEYLLGTRYHAIILGWIFGLKTLQISYSKKTLDTVDYLFPDQSTYNVREFISSDKLTKSDFIRMPTALLNAKCDEAKLQFAGLKKYLEDDSHRI